MARMSAERRRASRWTAAEPSPDAKEQLQRISLKAAEAAQEVKNRLRSVSMALEQKVAIEDHVQSVSREMESLLDGIDDISKKNQKNILTAYKRFLEENLRAVNKRLEEIR